MCSQEEKAVHNPARLAAAISTVARMDELEDAIPRCPTCLVLFDVVGDESLPYLLCGTCGDVFL